MIELWSFVIYKINIFGVIYLVISCNIFFLIKENPSNQFFHSFWKPVLNLKSEKWLISTKVQRNNSFNNLNIITKK